MFLSLNSEVSFRLTAKGEKILNEYYRQIDEKLKIYDAQIVVTLHKPDSEGYYYMTLREAMRIFGKNCYTAAGYIFIDHGIEIVSREEDGKKK